MTGAPVDARAPRAWLLAALGWTAAVAAAEPVEYPSALTDVPVAFVLNGQPRGDVFVKRADNGDLLLAPAVLESLGARPGGGTLYTSGGEPFLLLGSVPGARIEFDENVLRLALMLPPEAFGATRLSLSRQSNPSAVRTQDTSAFVNYRLAHSSFDGAPGLTALALEAAGRTGAFLVRNESLHLRADDRVDSVRFQTQLIHDDRDRIVRAVAGDAFATSGELGSTLNLGGISISKNYQLDPYFVRYPTVSFTGVATLPSDVQVFVGDAQVYRGRLPPGAFELDDFNYYGGRQDVRIVVRDALGQEQVLAYPYYFTDLALGAGLHEFRYAAGWLREDYGVRSNRYGPPAAAAVHRYGVTDSLTLGARAEYADGRANAGPMATVRLDRFGTVTLGVAASHDSAFDRSGAAGSAAYQYRMEAFNARAGYRELSADYAVADPFAGMRLLRYERLVGAGYGAPRWGNADVHYSESRVRGSPDLRIAAFNYSRALFRRMTLFAILRRTLSAPASTDVFAGLSFNFGRHMNLSAYRTSTPDSQSSVLQSANTLGAREGFGYRVSFEDARRAGVDSTRVSPYLEYNARHATLVAESRTEEFADGGTSDFWLAAVQGAVHGVGGDLDFSRRIDDSFAVVRITPPLAGVQVYHNSEVVGRTGADGTVSIPTLGSFLDNPIAIEDKDVPIAYSLARTSRIVSPPFRSGSLVEFEVRETRAVFGRLRLAGAGAGALQYHQAVLGVGDARIPFLLGGGAEFYVEDVPAGRHRGEVQVGVRSCRFELVVPSDGRLLHEIEEPIVCEMAR